MCQCNSRINHIAMNIIVYFPCKIIQIFNNLTSCDTHRIEPTAYFRPHVFTQKSARPRNSIFHLIGFA